MSYNEFIQKTIKETNYIVGKKLNEKLQEHFSITSENSRKIIQRAVKDKIIMSTKPVSFGNGQFVYYRMHKKFDRAMLLEVAKEFRPGMFRILSLMDLNDGIISKYEAMKIASCPLDIKNAKSDNITKLIKELETLKVVSLINDTRNITYLISNECIADAEIRMSKHFIKMRLDAMFIPDVIKYLEKINLVDPLTSYYRNKTVPSKAIKQYNFLWDAISHTKTTGINPEKAINATTNEKKTTVVFDIIISRVYTDNDFQGFFKRIQSVLSSTKSGVRKLLPIIIFSEIESLALNKIHKLGFLTLSIHDIYGKNISGIIKNINRLQSVYLGQDSQGENSVAIIETTLESIKNSGQEINLKNIVGDLFEFLMYPVMECIFPNSMKEQGRILKEYDNGKERQQEYDYLIRTQSEIIVIELKGKKSQSEISLGDYQKKDTVKWFYAHTYPFAKKMLTPESRNLPIRGCFITSGGFRDNAIEYMETLSNSAIKSTKLDIWYDRHKLMQLLDANGLKHVSKIINKYYSGDADSVDEELD
ncbi:MAG: hypothetical protein K9G49_09105 [Taibaiella sp.]|nr:hypothetical protein [Taibaiella sp.]